MVDSIRKANLHEIPEKLRPALNKSKYSLLHKHPDAIQSQFLYYAYVYLIGITYDEILTCHSVKRESNKSIGHPYHVY
jgi:hypothetical protein